MRRAVFALMASVSAVMPAFAWWSSDGEAPYGKWSMDYISPHIGFASPNAAKMKVFITASGAGQREIVELKQRFDYEPVLFPVLDQNRWSPFEGKNPKPLYARSMDEAGYREAAEKLYAELPGCDAVIIARSELKSVPKNDRERLFGRVREGAGLVWIAYGEKPDELPGVEMKPVDPESVFPCSLVPRLRDVKLYEGWMGKGRALQVVYSLPTDGGYGKKGYGANRWFDSLTPFEGDDPLYYDFYMAFVGKCLWRVTGWTAPAGLKRTESVYNAMGREVPATSRSGVLKLVRFLDSEGRCADYTIEKAACASSLSLTLEKDAFLPGETVNGEVKTRSGDKGTLVVSLTDELGVELCRRTVELDGSVASVPFSFVPVLRNGRYAEVRAALYTPRRLFGLAGGALLDEAWGDVYFNRLKEDRGEFSFTIWSSNTALSRVSELKFAQLRRAGIDCVMETNMWGPKFNQLKNVSRRYRRHGLNYAHYVTRITGPGMDNARDDPHGKGCVVYSRWEDWVKGGKKLPARDPVTGSWKAEFPMNAAEAAKGMGVFFYNLGDENMSSAAYTPENCFCDRCQRRFRAFLKRMYKGSIAALNAAHRADYKSFDEIRALTFIEAAKQRKMPLWTDFRVFMDEQFTNAHRYYCERIKAVDPEAVIGAEGYPFTHYFGVSLDYRQMLPMFGFCAPYFSSRDAHAVEAFLPEGGLKSSWLGSAEGRMNDAYQRRRPWYFLFNNLNGAFWWMADTGWGSQSFSNCTVFRPDLTPIRHFDLTSKEIRFIKESGLGRIMNKAKAMKDGVYVHYSNRSLYGSALNPTDQSWELSHLEFGTVLEEAAIGYRFLASVDLEVSGVPSDAKVLVLPYSQLMSGQECAAVRAFVERGGLLVADKLPGEFSEHGLELDRSPLAGLFGREVMKLKRTGKGAAVLTGKTLRGIDLKAGKNEASGLVARFAAMLAPFGVKPYAKVTDEKGEIRRADVLRSGGVTLVCMLGPNEPPREKVKLTNARGAENATRTVDAMGGSSRRIVTLGEPRWAYDMANGGSLIGHGRRFEFELEPVIGRVIAFTEREVSAPELALSSDSAAKGGKVTLAWKNVVGCAIVTAAAPDGRKVMTVRTTDTSLDFAPGWNEGEGVYRLEVRSAVGGMTAVAELKVK